MSSQYRWASLFLLEYSVVGPESIITRRDERRDGRKDALTAKKKKKDIEVTESRELFEEEDQQNYMEVDENESEASNEGRKVTRGVIDIMGPLSQTSDAKNISVRTRAVLAASVCNALGVDIRIRG